MAGSPTSLGRWCWQPRVPGQADHDRVRSLHPAAQPSGGGLSAPARGCPLRLGADRGQRRTGRLEQKQLQGRLHPLDLDTLFAVNFIHWAVLWLADQSLPARNALSVRKLGVKRPVRIVAHVSAQVSRDSEGRLLKLARINVADSHQKAMEATAYVSGLVGARSRRDKERQPVVEIDRTWQQDIGDPPGEGDHPSTGLQPGSYPG